MRANKLSLSETLHSIFKINKLEWRKTDGTKFLPTAEDFGQALDKVKSMLYDEEDGTQIEFGRLIVKKSADHYDVYCRLGEIV
jgi:hypothetical protein